MIARILRILRKYDGLTLHELCMLVNLGKIDYSYCRNCVYLYRRGDFKTEEAKHNYFSKLEKKPCRINYLRLMKIVNKLEEKGLVRSRKKRLQDPKSHHGYDYFRVIYIRRERRKSVLDYRDDIVRLDEVIL